MARLNRSVIRIASGLGVALLALGYWNESPAQASTVPRLDFSSSETFISLGLPDLSIDHAVTQNLSIGLSDFGLPGAGIQALRATLKLGALPGGGVWGITAAAGVYGYTLSPGQQGQTNSSTVGPWGQLAIDVSEPLTRYLTFRGTVGPVYPEAFGSVDWLWPNVELAIRTTASDEITLGGNSLVGWRHSM